VSGSFVPYGKQYIDDADIKAVVDALKRDYLTTGPTVGEFEAAFADAVGASDAVACVNGTAALHLAALGLNLGPGDCVIVPAVTFLATANAPRSTGAEVVFADVDPVTGLMGAREFEEAVARAPAPPKAVFPVHLGGPCCDLAAISEIAGGKRIEIVEDACHALGTSGLFGNDRFRIGDCHWSRMATFSTHPVKMLTTGEGGIVTMNDRALAARLRLLRNHGMTREPGEFLVPEQAFAESNEPLRWYYEMKEIGHNYRLTDVQCALGLSQLRKLDRFVARRRELVDCYRRLLDEAAIPGVTAIVADERLDVGWHLFRVRIDFAKTGRSRNILMSRLAERGIGSQVHYTPIYRQPYYARRYGEMRLPGAESYYEGTLSLPLYFGMTDSDVHRVAAALSAVMNEAGH
jgi:UDP-4-amino-4,6-dideoxy-N-acetyl-beta-L-altrosamine transaminase